jgi:hypothetical protein
VVVETEELEKLLLLNVLLLRQGLLLHSSVL